MASWRDTTSPEAQDDLDGLLNTVLTYAAKTLAEHGELYPFGAGVSVDGRTAMLVADLGKDAPADPGAVLEELAARARGASESGRAAAFVEDVLIEDDADGADALRVELEHREGIALEIFVPYTRHAAGPSVDLGEMIVEDGAARVWTDLS